MGRMADHVEHLADTISRRLIAARVGVGMTAVSTAISRGKFPASWFVEMQALCEERGIDCPVEAFNFKVPSSDTSLSEAS